MGALVCTKGDVHWGKDCNTCEDWRMIVWKEGSTHHEGDHHFLTQAGHIYGGHCQPPSCTCQAGDNYHDCASWTDIRGNNVQFFSYVTDTNYIYYTKKLSVFS